MSKGLQMPQVVDLKVGFSCNNDCIHCVVSDKKHENDLSIEHIKELIDHYISMYSQISLTLTGGEVTYRSDYPQIMQFLKDKKERGLITFVDLQTNGRLLLNDDILEVTIDVVDFYLIALHGSSPEVHDYITARPSSFKETTTALRKLIKKISPQSIAIQTVITKKNYTCLKNIYAFSYERFGITECNITFPHPLGVAYNTQVTPAYNEIAENVNDALEYCLANGINPYLEALPYCVFKEKLQPYVLEAYKKRNENVVGYGGERDGHIDYQEVLESGYAKYDTCRMCSFEEICHGVWKEYKELYPANDMYSLLHRP